jgi:type II restriction/modification system DNA methylase subunit YeeA
MHHYYGGHPEVGSPLELCYMLWKGQCQERFDQLKANEEELNSIFAGIYGMESEVPIEVPDDKVSVRLADLGRDIRSLISYGVGCMFGRYSLDKPGLILADEGSTLDDYHTKVPNPTFEPDRTGIIPITDADTEWFEDDIVAQFRRWLAAAYGQDTLDENIAFIEHALGKSLRAYFVRDFYDDHLKTYQKRPIYWLFQSPKKGLSALMYLHRYNPNTVTTLLTEYIRPLREQMEAQARLLEVTGNARDVSTATKYRASIDELDKWEHDVIFPLSQKHVALDLDDGVKANYGKPEFKGALRKVAGLN